MTAEIAKVNAEFAKRPETTENGAPEFTNSVRVYHLSMPRKPASAMTPTITISRRGVERLRAGHVWVYRWDVASADGVAARRAGGCC